jgi:PAS domain S-box-containing protein
MRRAKVISWNIGAERLMGYAEHEILGRSGDVIFTAEDRAARAPERECDEALAAGRAEDDRWHLRKDGSRFWGPGLLMPFPNGRSGFVKILRDRTEEHRAMEALGESEARFRLPATSIPQLVFRSRATGERTWGSPQWEIYASLSDQESHDFGWLEALQPDDREATLAAWQTAPQTGECSVAHRIRRALDGEYRWHQTRARPIGSGDDGMTEWGGTSTDIHELRGLQGRQQVLLSELQHRSRNLLTVVQGTAGQTARTTRSLEEFTSEFSGRLEALARAQSLIEETNHGMIELRAIACGPRRRRERDSERRPGRAAAEVNPGSGLGAARAGDQRGQIWRPPRARWGTGCDLAFAGRQGKAPCGLEWREAA